MKQRGSILILLLVFTGALLITNAGSFLYGKHIEKAEAAQARETAISNAIKAHNEDALVDMQAAYEHGRDEALARTRSNQNRQEFNNALSAAPRRPDACDMPKLAFDRLLDAVNLANADKDAPKLVPANVPRSSQALKPPR